jgi:hypothetical protein
MAVQEFDILKKEAITQIATDLETAVAEDASAALISEQNAKASELAAEGYKNTVLANTILLGGIAHNATAPTPSKSGIYEFTSAGVCLWLGGTSVAIGDRAIVVYDTTYTYTYQANPNTNIVQTTGTGTNVVMSQNAVTDTTQALATRLDNIIIESGTSDAEVIDARGTFSTLKKRLDAGDVINIDKAYVSTIQQLKTAITSGKKHIILGTDGYIELGEKITIPANVTLSAYNGFIKRQEGYDGILFEIDSNTKLLGLTIDGNRSAVVTKYWGSSIEIFTKNHDRTKVGSLIKDCKIVNGNCAVMYFGWNNTIENCVFEDLGSAAVHYSGNYHSSVKGCFFTKCCEEGLAYRHSEGAILFSDYTGYSTIEDNYFEDCGEAAIGGMDNSENNSIIIRNNKMVRTGGITGTWGGGEAPSNLVIENNIIIDSAFGAQSYYSNFASAGIMLTRVTNTPNVVSLYQLNNLTISGNILYNSCLKIGGAINALIQNNRVYNFTIDTAATIVFELSSSRICGNTFLETHSASGIRLTLRNSEFTSNIITARGRELWLSDSHNVTIKDNHINHNNGYSAWFDATNSTKIDMYHNLINVMGYGNGCIIPDFSIISENMFLGSTAWGTNRYTVGAASKYVAVRDNYYCPNAANDGTTQNGCVNAGNLQLASNPVEIVSTTIFALTDLTSDYAGSGGDDGYLIGNPLFIKLIASNGYSLPETIVITCKDDAGQTKTMVAGDVNKAYEGFEADDNFLKWILLNDYTYNNETGGIFIPVAYPNITITANGVPI